MNQSDIIHIERKIAIGMIVNTEFLSKIINILNIKFVQSKEAKLIMSWCIEYYNEFKKAPNQNMEELYFEKLRTTNLQKSTGKLIEDILEDLSEEFEKEQESLNVDYLMKQSTLYCKTTKLKEYAKQIEDEIEHGNVLEAESLLVNFKPVEELKSNSIIPLGSVEQIKKCFDVSSRPLIKLPGIVNGLGDMINHTLIQEGFVVYLAPNKSGKSYILMKNAILAAKQGYNVAFFQAGDMSQEQMEKRMAVSFAKKSDIKKYCGELLVPVLDCYYNQNGECDYKWREGGKDLSFPLEDIKDNKRFDFLTKYPFSMIKELYDEYYDHVPCYNCKRKGLLNNFSGSIWWKKREAVEPLGWKETYHLINKKYKHITNKIKLMTYASDSLTISKINMELDILEKQGFFPHVVIIDYLDLCAPDIDTKMLSQRDQENKKWKRARRLSQEKKILLLSASQSDAQGFDAMFLQRKHFSEDRRKLDHVTAMYGLNMTDEEKKKGVMRINDIVGRETEGGNFVFNTHRLQMGNPIINSFY